MKSRETIRALRRALVSRIFAAFLVVLAASPLTAPFSTCDFAELSGDSSAHEGKLFADKIDHDAAVSGIVVSIALPPASGVLVEAPGLAGDTGSRQTRPLVLRL